MKDPADEKGLVFDIRRFSVHDGPGIRTTVFLKGCPLRCLWCHNPESQNRFPELMFDGQKCTGCGRCFSVCPEKAHKLTEDGVHFIDRDLCTNCSLCTEVCSPGALRTAGRLMPVSEVMEDVAEDLPFYEKTGGGVTFSGGEPMSQYRFIKALLKESKKLGIHTGLDTSGYAPWDNYRVLLDDVDLFLFDIKETDSVKHKDITGVDNEKILENLAQIDAAGKKIALRAPFIPGINNRKGHLEKMVDIALELNCLESVELLEYHPLGVSKLEQLGRTNPLEDEKRNPVAESDSVTFKEAVEILLSRLPPGKVINLR